MSICSTAEAGASPEARRRATLRLNWRSKSEAATEYWKFYYRWAEDFQSELPRHFRIVDMECLNMEEGVRSILDFCGFDKPVVEVGIKRNENPTALEWTDYALPGGRPAGIPYARPGNPCL